MPFDLPFRHASRSLRRAPAFTVTAVLTLVIGIGAAVAIFSVVDGVLLRPLPYGNPDRLVGAWMNLPPMGLTHVEQTQTTYYTVQRLARTIDGIGLYQESSANVSDPGGTAEPQRLPVAWMTATLMPVLQVSPLLGRNFTAAEDVRAAPTAGGGATGAPAVVIISEGLWRSRFNADRGVLGRTIEISGAPRTIVGVMPSRFRFPTAATELWLPLGLDPLNKYPGGFQYNAIARLKPGVTLEAAERDFTAALTHLVELYPMFAPGVPTQALLDQAKPVPLLVPLRDDVTGGIAQTLWIVAAASVLVLLVACVNVSNLILVRADGRQRELAVREALGAGRARVLAHFLAESAVLAVVAGAGGLGAATLAVKLFVRTAPAAVPRLSEVSVDVRAITFAAVLTIFVAVFCSIIPALRVGRAHLSDALREGGRGGTTGRARQRVRGALVTAQIAIALVVLAGSGLLLRTFQALHQIHPGFDPRHVATFWMSPSAGRHPGDAGIARFYADVEARIAQIPGVAEVGLASHIPLSRNGSDNEPLYPTDDASYATKIPPLQVRNSVNGGYFRAMGIPLVAGRVFDRLDGQRAGEAIVSRRTAFEFWKDSTGVAALGKEFRLMPAGPVQTIVGVVGDVRDTALAAPVAQIVYLPEVAERDTALSSIMRTMALVVRTSGDPAAITPAIRAAMRELDPSLPLFDVKTMASALDASTARLQFTVFILGAAAAITLALGAIGLYGVMAYVVTLRRREMGVRIALGAQPRAVAAMMTRQGLALTGFGIAAGLALFALVARFLSSFLYGVTPLDPVTLVAASALLAAVAALASWIPARRAARADPSEALRAE